MIQTQAQLSNFLNVIQDDTHLAIDTEFKWTSTYYAQLCLLQIATDNTAECIDVLAIKNLQPLFNKLYQPNVMWIAHAARNDIEVLYHYSKQLPAQVFDTQIACSLLKNLRPDSSNFSAQISYQALTKILQGVDLDKAYTRLDWSKRPIPDKAIQYALDDVIYLIKNYHQLKTLLETQQKLGWLMEEGQAILDINLYQDNIFQAYNRIKGFSRLPKRLHEYAAQLAAWRELTAIDKNQPRKWAMPDNDLINIAMGKQCLPNNKQQQFAKFLSANPHQGELNIQQHSAPTPAEKAQKLILQNLIQQKANQYNLPIEILANSKSLLKYIRGDNSVIFMRGWRYQLLQKELQTCKTV